jgi:hypothetical protein
MIEGQDQALVSVTPPDVGQAHPKDVEQATEKTKQPRKPRAKKEPEVVSCDTVSMDHFCKRVGISPALFWRLGADGRIKIIKIGGKVRVTTKELQRVLEEGTDKVNFGPRKSV